jgi:hypothetical protein
MEDQDIIDLLQTLDATSEKDKSIKEVLVRTLKEKRDESQYSLGVVGGFAIGILGSIAIVLVLMVCGVF